MNSDGSCNTKTSTSKSSASPNHHSINSSSSSSSCNNAATTTKTMEEVWNDVNLFSLRHHHNHLHLRGMTLQDFLSRPFSHVPTPTTTTPNAAAVVYSPPPPTSISLTINFEPENHRNFHFLNNSQLVNNLDFPFAASPFDAASPPANLKKRLPEPEINSGDRRHKRMIKNRESAARSRARKQAYTNELELEVAHLLEENAKLRKQQQQALVAADAQFPKKKSLQRTSTAPF